MYWSEAIRLINPSSQTRYRSVMPRIPRNMKKFNIRDVRRAFRIRKESS